MLIFTDIGDIWKPIIGYDGQYFVSREGDIMRRTGSKNQNGETPPHLMNLCDNGNGYKIVNLKGKMHYVHRLVASHFLDNLDNKPQVNHIDSDKENNHYSNLEWVYQSENTNHSIAAGGVNSTNKNRRNINRLTKQNICDIACLYHNHVGVSAISRSLGLPRTTVSSVINGRSNKELFQFILSELQEFNHIRVDFSVKVE